MSIEPNVGENIRISGGKCLKLQKQCQSSSCSINCKISVLPASI